jgi:hypothetical protein
MKKTRTQIVKQILLDFEAKKSSVDQAAKIIVGLVEIKDEEPIKKDVSFLATFWFLAVTGMAVWGLGIMYAFSWLLGVIKNVL